MIGVRENTVMNLVEVRDLQRFRHGIHFFVADTPGPFQEDRGVGSHNTQAGEVGIRPFDISLPQVRVRR
jgi:hypothetical protein